METQSLKVKLHWADWRFFSPFSHRWWKTPVLQWCRNEGRTTEVGKVIQLFYLKDIVIFNRDQSTQVQQKHGKVNVYIHFLSYFFQTSKILWSEKSCEEISLFFIFFYFFLWICSVINCIRKGTVEEMSPGRLWP